MQKAAYSSDIAACGLLIFVALLAMAVTNTGAFAAAWDLISSPGQCRYTYDRIPDEKITECSAVAIIMNTQTSEVIRCSAFVKGNQSMAPSVEENVPESVFCVSVGQVMSSGNRFGITTLDDSFVDDNTKIRRRGNFVWANAFWVHTRDGDLDVRICAARRVIQNPDFGQICSKKVVWPDQRSN